MHVHVFGLCFHDLYEVYLLSSVITDYIIVKSHAYCKFQLITYEKGLYTCVV